MVRPRKYEGTLKERQYQAKCAYIKKHLKQLNLKIDPALYERLNTEAKKNHVSLRKFCLKRLSDGLKIEHKL